MANVPEYAYPDTMSRIWARGNYALWTVALLALVVFGMCWQSVRLTRLLEQRKPLWVFADDVGRAHAKDYEAVEFNQHNTRFERVVKSTVAEFVTLQFQIKKRTVAEDLPKALLFMTKEQADRYEYAYRNGYINKLLHDSSADVEIGSPNVSLLGSLAQCGESAQPPCSALVQFVETKESETKDCTVDVQFYRVDSDDPARYLVNPLGLAASDFPKQCGAAKQAANVR